MKYLDQVSCAEGPHLNSKAKEFAYPVLEMGEKSNLLGTLLLWHEEEGMLGGFGSSY